jgi:RNA polymerase sigma-70 factor (ECF subfamily)
VSDPVSACTIEPLVPDEAGPRTTRPTRRGRVRLDRPQFDAVFEEHYQRLVRALTVVAGDSETAADAVQEAFVKAHLRWRRISTYEDPAGWVRRVAINQLHDVHRRTARKRRVLERLSVRSETVDELPEIDEFDRLLGSLPRQQRAVTALFYVDGLSIAEIAVSLEIAEGSVKSHLHDARRRLKPTLEHEARHADGTTKDPHHG